MDAVIDFAIDRPAITLAVVLLAWVAKLVAAAALDAFNRSRRDPRRGFTKAQRSAIFAACQYRCEHVSPWLLRRCRRAAEHADHIWPWARRGATTEANGQGLCARHNLSKGATKPSVAYRYRLRRSRRNYHASNPKLGSVELRRQDPGLPRSGRGCQPPNLR